MYSDVAWFIVNMYINRKTVAYLYLRCGLVPFMLPQHKTSFHDRELSLSKIQFHN
jgi:hypothetical protein